MSAEAPTVNETALPKLFHEYLGKLKRKHRKPSTIYSARTALVAFTRYLDEQGIRVEDVTGDTLYDYFENSKYAASTRRLHAIKIKAAFAFGLRTRRIENDPFDEDEGFAVPAEVLPEIEDKIIPASDLRSMRRTAAGWHNPNSLLLFLLLAYTGLRLNECRTLEWSDVDWNEERIKLRAVNAKGGKPRVVPIHPDLLDALKDRNPDRKMRGCVLSPTYSYVTRTLKGERTITIVGGRGSKKLGDPYAPGTAFETLKDSFADDYSFHCFRKTWMNSLYKAQVQDGVIKAMGGWAKRGTMESYYLGVTLEQMREAILRLYEDDPI